MNLIINLDHDDWILTDPDATLQSVGCGEYPPTHFQLAWG